jgi:glycine cleavage system H protein
VNENPYGVWLFKIKPSSNESFISESNQLLSLEQYSSGPGA